MATTAEIKNGLNIVFNNDIYAVVEFQHVKPGKGNAFVRTRLKSRTTGRQLEHTFPAGAKIDTARVETREYQYLYKDEIGYHFMNNENFEQMSLEEHQINAPQYLTDGIVCLVVYHAEKDQVLGCELPSSVSVKVTYTEPGLKGDTASGNALKHATVDTGAKVMVPLFINIDEQIKVDTRTNEYIERVK